MSSGMAFQCPQCKSPVPASPVQIGQAVVCPHCRTEFRLSPSQMVAATPAAEPAAANEPAAKPNVARFAARPGNSPQAPVPAKPNPNPQGPGVPKPLPPMPGYTPTSTGSTPIAPPPPPPVAEPEPPSAASKKVARLVTGGDAPSTVSLTAEGKLPELHLAEAVAKPKGETPKKMNPIVLAAVLTMSMVSSMAIIFMNNSDPSETAETTSVETARKQLQKYYPKPPIPDKTYQTLLRDSQRAHARGDNSAERDAYRKVLQLLRAERSPYKGLTGAPSTDRELERLLRTLLANEES